MTEKNTVEARMNAMEKKLSTMVRTNARIQMETAEHFSKIDKALENLRKGMPHINFGE